MGTPGDKAKISQVVEPFEEAAPSQHRPQSSAAAAPPQPPGAVPMGLPRFETLATSGVAAVAAAALGKSPETPQSPGQIDFYYSHSKYYPSVSENVHGPFSNLQQQQDALKQKPQKTFPVPSMDQPGPSGVQTPKTKPIAAPQRLKKHKKRDSSPATPKKTYSCSVCQKNYASSEKLAKHQQTHTHSSPFKCDHCKKVFTSKFKLVRHTLIHSDSKPFVCSVCERTFHRKDHLKNHFKVHSPCKEVFACDKPNCKKEYTSVLSFKKHLAIHEAEEGNLTCQICSFKFETKEEIIYHLKIHAGSRTVKNPEEKKYTCEHCDRKFFTKKDVRRHLVVHTGMRDFLCQFCPQRFGRKDHLVRHIKKSHNFKYQSDEQQQATTAKVDKKRLPETETSSSADRFKSNISESSNVSNATDFHLELLDNLTNIDETLFLDPSTSNEAPPELRDLGPIELDEEIQAAGPIDIPPSTSTSALFDDSFDIVGQVTNVLDDVEFNRLLKEEPLEDEDGEAKEKKPLPSFSKTFQPPPT